MNIFKKIRASLRLAEAIRQADNAYKENRRRYYVMPNGAKGKLLIVDRKNFRLLRMKGYIDKKATTADMERECFYCTPFPNGKNEITPEIAKFKREQYYNWIDQK